MNESEIIELPNQLLKFNVQSELEKYRAQSIFVKEPETIAWINKWAQSDSLENTTFYDIGANIGVFSMYAASVRSRLNVYSFEPVFSNYQALRLNRILNGFDNVTAINLALSDSNRIESLYIVDERVGNSGAQFGSPVNEKGEVFKAVGVERVLGVTVDHLVEALGFPIPDYVKIDVDGHESQILYGMSKTLQSKKVKSLLVEFNSSAEFNEWEPYFYSVGYCVDSTFDNVPGHSRHRRESQKSLARNCIFTRQR